jgi:hypothetical protein
VLFLPPLQARFAAAPNPLVFQPTLEPFPEFYIVIDSYIAQQDAVVVDWYYLSSGQSWSR